MSAAPTFTEIDASADGRARLAKFYRQLYVAQFPDPNERESLANMLRYLALKASGWYGRNSYHVIVMEERGVPIGGSVSDYLAAPNAGVIEFLFTSTARRKSGYGSALLDATIRALDGDARSADHADLTAVVAEMNDPFRHPDTPDNMDPFQRAAIWGRWGFCKLEFPYVQPALSRTQRPVRNLALVAKLVRRPAATSVEPRWVASVLREYMRWAMRIPQPSRNAEYRAMARYLARRTNVPLIPLNDYVGRGATRLDTEEIDAKHPAFGAAMALLQQALPHSGRTASPADFERALARRGGRAYHYHLWRVAVPGSSAVDGVASFFTFARAGFGGYIAFARRMRGKGLLRPLIARIEERMIRDGTRADGWFIECDSASARIFEAVGFLRLRVDYRPPRVGTEAAAGDPERLVLLYKSFGSAARTKLPPRRFVLDGVAAILRGVYGIREPRRHPCYRRAAR